LITTAQVVTTTFLKGKEAFKSIPELNQSRLQIIATKRIPQVDTNKLLKEADAVAKIVITIGKNQFNLQILPILPTIPRFLLSLLIIQNM